MTQLILDVNGVALAMPESRKGGYRCQNTPLGVDAEMASGRLTRELRGRVYVLSYQYGFLNEQQKNDFLAACEKGWGQPIVCGFLAPDAGSLQYAEFLVTDLQYPKFLWSHEKDENDEPLWGDFRVELREVSPHE